MLGPATCPYTINKETWKREKIGDLLHDLGRNRKNTLQFICSHLLGVDMTFSFK
jgi:hypothetical protein